MVYHCFIIIRDDWGLGLKGFSTQGDLIYSQREREDQVQG